MLRNPRIDRTTLSQRASHVTILTGSELILKEKTRKQLDDPTVGDGGLSVGYNGAGGRTAGLTELLQRWYLDGAGGCTAHRVR